jgi:hypothetical protein
MRFRQVHLDFHTSEAIPAIGAQFSKSQFQEMLKRGSVDSITVFSKCHHGWAYHPSLANETHPNLGFDLLGAQIEAAHEIGVNTPVYLSAGLDEKEARRQPDWLIRDANDRTNWVDSFLKPGFHQFCMNTPYLDQLVAQIEEVVQNYDVDGIFLDIVGVRSCVCNRCIAAIVEAGGDPKDPVDVLAMGEKTYANYTARTNDAVHRHKPGLPIFHNGSHIRRGRRDLAHCNTHLELESLPTGGWGYDHFPLSARYAATLGMDYLGMTGKFHATWGEFGGYKHPNALRYEASLSLANGARVSIGDQLHPSGEMDPATYALIGAAYAEVEQKEPYCVGAKGIADIAVLSNEVLTGQGREDVSARTGKSDVGAIRVLLEGKFLFDVIDLKQDLAAYKVVVLPDGIRVDDTLKARLETFFAGGGRVLATGESGLNIAGDAFAIDLGARYLGPAGYRPDYYRPNAALPNLGDAAFIMFGQGQKVAANPGASVHGSRENPYFNREWNHFTSHEHTPSTRVTAGPAMIENRNGIYFAWNAFQDYATKGQLAVKESLVFALNRLLGNRKTLTTNLPAQGIATLTEQPAESRFVCHLLYASPVKRGENIEVIEDLLPLFETEIALRLPNPIRRVSLAPQGSDLPFTQDAEGVHFTVPRWECHQMIVLDEA